MTSLLILEWDENSFKSKEENGTGITKSLFLNQNGNYTRSNALLDIFDNEAMIGDELQFKMLRTQHREMDISKFMGKVAEYTVVYVCRKEKEINRHLSAIARNGKYQSSFLDQYMAIGTGLNPTKNDKNLKEHYQPNDTQRDIVWVSIKDKKSLLVKPNFVGQFAGLQLKTSIYWRNIIDDLEKYKYPILYFDLNDDWEKLNKWIEQKKDTDENFKEVRLVEPTDEILYLKNIIKEHHKMIKALYDGKISISYLIDYARDNLIVELAASFKIVNKTNIVIPN